MTFAAAVTASRRGQELKGSLLLSFYAIAAGAGIVVAGMLATRALTSDIAILVPVGTCDMVARCRRASARTGSRYVLV
jgi:putative ABC transport system permease protein